MGKPKAKGQNPKGAKPRRLADFRPQTRNVNRGKPHGLAALDKSLRRNGYSAPMVAAADGEIFAGSKRLETAADVFGADVEPIVVHSDGRRPVIHVRDDIPNADDPRAVELGYADNAIAAADWNPDGALLAELAAQSDYIKDLARQENASLKALADGDVIILGMDAFGNLPDEDRAPFRQVTFTLHDSQFERVVLVVKRAKESGPFVNSPNENSNGNALARICDTYNGNGA